MQPHIRWTAALAFLTFVHTQAEEIITQWNFNSGDAASPPSSLGAGTATPLGAVSTSLASGTGSSDPSAPNNAWSLASFPKQGLAAHTAGAGFATSTAGYETIRFSFDLRASGTASRRVVVLYTSDGTTFVEAAGFTLSTSGTFTNRLSVDLTAAAAVNDNPAFAVRLVSDFADGGQYQGVTSTYSSSGTWRFDHVTVTGSPIGGAPILPHIVSAPEDRTVLAGESAMFTVVATGSPPLTYQWRHGDEELVGQTGATLALENVHPGQAGEYRVRIGNVAGSTLSGPAVLTVEEPPPPPVIEVTNLTHLRSLVDPVARVPAETSSLFTVRGLVITHANLATSPDQMFFLQDGTSGIAVAITDAASPIPKAGAEIEVTGRLGQVNGLLQLQLAGTNKHHSVKALSDGHPLPPPRLITAATANDTALAESIEGTYVTMQDVTLDTARPEFSNTSATYLLRSNDGAEFPLRVDSRTDINGQPKPVGPFTVHGVLSQSHTNAATTPDDGWFLLPTRYADLSPKARPPVIAFTVRLEHLVRPGDAVTNTFTEQCVRPGESMALKFTVTDPDGDRVTFARAKFDGGLPPAAQPDITIIEADPGAPDTGREMQATVVYVARAEDAGREFVIPLEAHDPGGAGTGVEIRIYVPTAAEQAVAITEFLANPTSDPAAAHFNPLSRPAPADDPPADDEFIELVNLGSAPFDVSGWTLSDAQRIRHDFGTNTLLFPSRSALVIFGGPPEVNAPGLPTPAIPASTGSLSLNNTGDTILLRNAASNLVARVVYSAGDPAPDGSRQRATLDGEFLHGPGVGVLATSAGRRADGSAWADVVTPPALTAPIRVEVIADSGHVRLTFNTEPGHTYSIHRADSVGGAFPPLAQGLMSGVYEEVPPESVAWFYRISSP